MKRALLSPEKRSEIQKGEVAMRISLANWATAGVLACLAGGVVFGTALSGSESDHSDQPGTPELEPGWKWELEPTPIRGLAESEFWRFVPSGVLSATYGSNQTVTVLHVRNKDLDLRGAQTPEFRVFLIDRDGEPHQRATSSSMSNQDLFLSRFQFRGFDDPEQITAIGLAVLTLEGRRELSLIRAAEAAEQGIDVLPLPVIGEPFSFDLPLADGGRIRSQDLIGKVVLFDGWATWCHPCMMKMPQLKQVYERYESEGLVVIGLNFDREWDLAEQAIADGELDWPHVYGSQTDEHARFWAEVTGIRSLPRLFIVDRDGILREDAYPHDLDRLVAPYIEGAAAP